MLRTKNTYTPTVLPFEGAYAVDSREAAYARNDYFAKRLAAAEDVSMDFGNAVGNRHLFKRRATQEGHGAYRGQVLRNNYNNSSFASST